MNQNTLSNTDITFLLSQAKEALETGDCATSSQLTELILSFKPEHVPSRVLNGLAHEELGNCMTAETQYSYAIDISPKHTLALARRGELRLRRGDKGAKDDLQAAVAADSGLHSLPAQRAKALLAKN